VSTLVLAWGNPGRLDDGLGPAFAERATGWLLRDVVVQSDYQLQVEDAHEAALYQRVVFVDADRTGPEPFRFERLRPLESGIGFSTHSVSPGAVLALARDLFGAEPEAWLVGIRGYTFDEFGERLSDRARANLDAAANYLQRALNSGNFENPPDSHGEPPRIGHDEVTHG
jgi:hydrogenase maturation protease